MSQARETLVSGRLLLAFASALLVTGITNAFPVFFPPLLAEFGGSRAATASTITLIWVAGAILGPISGWIVARWNPRASVSLGLLSAALGFALGSVSHSLTVFRLAVGLGVGVGVGLTGMVTQAALLADAYVVRRGDRTFAESAPRVVAAAPDGSLSPRLVLPLAGAPPGRYEIQLTLTDERTGASMERRDPFLVDAS